MVMKSVMSSVVALFLFELLIAISTINISFCNGSSYVGCIETEREALLKFKGDLKDPFNRLASWIGDADCCRWTGIVCDNFTGQVLQLQLGNPSNFSDVEYEDRSRLVGKINPSLLDLKHLVYLDLSGNNFTGNQIPRFLGSMINLRYLNLSNSLFEGPIPPQLGNLSNLQYLDLNQHYNYELYVENLNWASGLSLLLHLDLSFVNHTKADDWLLDLTPLSHLEVLKLSDCELQHFPQLLVANFSSLATLDLHDNNFRGSIPEILQNFTSLRYLDLSTNHFNSSIPNWFYKSFSHLEYLSLRTNNFRDMSLSDIGNLTSLQNLDLSNNLKFEGKIPTSWDTLCNLKSISLSYLNLSQEISEILDTFSGCISDGLELLDLTGTQLFGHLTNQLGKLKNIRTLDFSHNSISGLIPICLGELLFLKNLDLSYNKLSGTFSEIYFSNLTRLESFHISQNSLKLKMSHDWIPPFQLNELGLGSCEIGPQFPLWLSFQKQLKHIDMSNSSLDDRIPNWFWESSSLFIFLDLSRNQIHGQIPNLSVPSMVVDLSWNNFSGSLPVLYPNGSLDYLDLSNNDFSGSIFNFVCVDVKEARGTVELNLQNNFLSGELPDCWSSWQNLEILNLGNNKFTGILQPSLGSLSSLRSLNLHKNYLLGTIPVSLKNCSNLGVFDVSENKFTGNIPTWIGENLLFMTILNLHSNKFFGLLPLELCHLGQLQILNLADNNLSGTIPRCVSNLSAMATIKKLPHTHMYSSEFPGATAESVVLVVKGKAVQYSTILNLIRFIDLSGNNFAGDIPMEVTKLKALQSLNLSKNSFTGRIPETIGAMKSLEALDFSANQLSGKIPQSFSNLSFLSYLDLSNNKLIGEIPLSTQLQGFDPSYFIGNKLCGPPLEKCSSEVPKSDYGKGGREDDNEHEVDWGFYVSMIVGFVMGIWCVLCPLFVSRRWRGTYYTFLNLLWDKFYLTVVRRYY